jgi:hypothetical protein
MLPILATTSAIGVAIGIGAPVPLDSFGAILAFLAALAFVVCVWDSSRRIRQGFLSAKQSYQEKPAVAGLVVRASPRNALGLLLLGLLLVAAAVAWWLWPELPNERRRHAGAVVLLAGGLLMTAMTVYGHRAYGGSQLVIGEDRLQTLDRHGSVFWELPYEDVGEFKLTIQRLGRSPQPMVAFLYREPTPEQMRIRERSGYDGLLGDLYVENQEAILEKILAQYREFMASNPASRV